jgi:hypothetical protein|tara:strand:+ start:289 stop:984 length:696 start_codon:yes stop_codon:yes gene_type:complete
MPKFGSTRVRKIADMTLDDLADQIRDRVLVSEAIGAEHIQRTAFSQLQAKSTVSVSSIRDGSIVESKLSAHVRQKINSAKQLAEQAVNAAAFRFHQEITDLEGAFAARLERAVSLASNAIQPGVRAFLHSLKTGTIEFGTTTINADVAISSTSSTFYTVVTSGGNVTVDLPNAGLCKGLMLGFYKSVAANDMILDGAASQTINGSTTKTFSSQHDAVIIISNGSNWFIISS